MMLDALGQLARLPHTKALFRKANDAGPELSAHQQMLRLTMHARNVGRRPESEQITTFNDVLSAITHLPRQDRWQPLECLAKQISALPELPSGARGAAFRSVANAIDKLLAKHRVGPLTTLASQVSSLPENEQLAAVDRVIAQAGELYDEHASDVLSALVRDFRGSRQVMLGLFERVEVAATSLDADHRAEPIVALVEKLVKLSPAERPRAAVRLIDVGEGMSDEARADTLASVAAELDRLPLQSRSATFNHLLPAISRLPLDSRSGPLSMLAKRAEYLPELELAPALHAIIDLAIGLSEPFYRICTPLASKCLPDDAERLALFERIIAWVELLPGSEARWPLRGLSGRIKDLPLEARSAVFHRILRQVPGLPPEDAADVLQLHVFPIFDLRDDDRLPAMRALIADFGRLPYKQFREDKSENLSNLELLVSVLPLQDKSEGYLLLNTFADRRY